VLGVGSVAPIAWRRRAPMTVFFISGMSAFAAIASGHVVGGSPIGPMIALYTVAAWCDRRRSLAAALVSVVGVLAAVVVAPRPGGFELRFLIAPAAVVVITWLIGDNVRVRRAYVAQLEARAEQLEREQATEAQRAVDGERTRIARELHDVVAHHVSVIGVQAAGARRVMDRQPALAAEALSSIEASSRQAVVELHRLLGFLRRSDDVDVLSPQPGLGQLADLIAEAGHAKLKVDLTIEGQPAVLSPTLEVSAYRVIQEALTNIRKHSAAKTARVRIEYGTTDLEVEILDDGPGRKTDPPGTRAGHGLIGMRERAALHGGHLSSGPRPDRGFAVHATFPLNSDAA
jgi:signal transduction histidine kinase